TVVRAGLRVRTDRLAVPGCGEVYERRGGRLLAFFLGVVLVLAGVERLEVVDQRLHLGATLLLVAARQRTVGHSALSIARLGTRGLLAHEAVIGLNRGFPLTSVVVELSQALEHVEGLRLVLRET